MGRSSYARRSNPDELAHKAYKVTRNSYGLMIEIVKTIHWEDFLQSVDDKTIWTAHQYTSGAPTDSGKSWVPTLNLGTQEDGSTSEAISNEEKANTFIATFSKPELEEQTSTNDEYPPQNFLFSTILNIQIKCVIT